MKYFIILLFSFLFFSLNAQISFGFNGAIGTSKSYQTNLQNGFEPDYKFGTSYQIGVFTAFGSGLVSFSLNPSFLSTSSVLVEDNVNDLNFIRTHNYLAVPIFLDFHFFDFLVLSPGIEFGALVNAKFKSEYFNSNGNAYESIDKILLAPVFKVQVDLFPKFSLFLKYSNNLLPLSSINFTDVNGKPSGKSSEKNYYAHTGIAFYISK